MEGSLCPGSSKRPKPPIESRERLSHKFEENWGGIGTRRPNSPPWNHAPPLQRDAMFGQGLA